MGDLAMPRGIRNNNPLNIRRTSTRWAGQIASDTERAFVVFMDMAHGVRAAAKVIQNYQRLYGINTVRRLIERWAPPNENHTPAYIVAVAAALGVGQDDTLDLAAHDILYKLIPAMSRVENGRRPDGSDWLRSEDVDAGLAMLRL